MKHFIQLTRPVNVSIIALTMYGLGWYLDGINSFASENGIGSFDFFLLVFSTALIAAGGNIINDYFDVRADRINKPEKLIIDKYVKRRVAIVTHWAINAVAFAMAIYLSWKLQTFWYVFIHLFSINILWFYSSHFKRKAFIGNFLIAALTGLVPLLVGLYFFQNNNLNEHPTSLEYIFPFQSFEITSNFIIWLSIAFAGFAFLLNMAREIVKDMEDIEGDKVLRAKTIPIVLGNKTSKWIVAAILIAVTALIASLWFEYPFLSVLGFIPVFLSGIIALIAMFMLFNASDKVQFKRVNTCLKLAMISGLLSPVFWKLLIIYGQF